MSLALLFHYLLLNMFRMLVHLSSGAYDLLWIYFMCCIALVRCVLVWFGWGGVVSLCGLKHYWSLLLDFICMTGRFYGSTAQESLRPPHRQGFEIILRNTTFGRTPLGE